MASSSEPTKITEVVTDSFARHLANRLGYGVTTGLMHQIQQVGSRSWINAQLNPDGIDDAPGIADFSTNLEIVRTPAPELYRRYVMTYKELPVLEKQTIRKQWQRLYEEQRSLRLYRSVHTEKQLEQTLTEFWFNHFNVFAPKSSIMVWLHDYEETIRRNCMGNFRILLGEITKHPAMLIYLDNASNQKQSIDAKGKVRGINENFARELLELHTMGVHGGYSQADVTAMARILTGWGLNQKGLKAGYHEPFFFDASKHDLAPKRLLGKEFDQNNISEGEAALDLLAMHPATANFLCHKLAVFFLSETPPAELVDSMSREFLRSNGSIRAVLMLLLHSPDFVATRNQGSLFKTPYHFAISSIRASGFDISNPTPVLAFLKVSGQPLYEWLTPDGYPYRADRWLQPDGLIKRLDFCNRICRHPEILGANTQPTSPEGVRESIGASSPLHNSLSTSEQVYLSLAAPENMRR